MLGTWATTSGLTIEVHTSASNHGTYIVLSMIGEESRAND